MTATECSGGSPTATGFILGVLGASGGVGASAVATACAVRAASAHREVVLVDTHPWGGGVEVMAGMDSAPGLRWADLTGVRGDVDGRRLVGELPTGAAGLRCLSWGAHAPLDDPLGPDPVLTAVASVAEVTVIDLPRPGSPQRIHQSWWQACDEVVLVVEPSVVGISAAVVVAQTIAGVSGVVLRTPTPLCDQDLLTTVGARVLVRLGDDSSVRRCLERGEAVGSVRGELADAADEVLAMVLPGLRAA